MKIHARLFELYYNPAYIRTLADAMDCVHENTGQLLHVILLTGIRLAVTVPIIVAVSFHRRNATTPKNYAQDNC